MKNLEQTLNPNQWGDLITKYSADAKKVSSYDFTNGTVNVDTDFDGSLTKRKGYVHYSDINDIPKDQFEAIFSDGSRHLLTVSGGEVEYSSGDGVTNSVVNGTGFSTGANFEFALTQDRAYGGNAVDSPIVYDRTTSYGGVGYTAPQIKTMGAQAPGSAPTAGAPTAGGSVPDGAHTYKITFLYYDFEESNGSAASGVQTAGAGNNTIPLSSIPTGGYGVTARKIYRDDNDGVWLHIATISDNTTTTFNDTISVGVTPTPIPEDHDIPPSFSLISLWLDRLFIAGVPGDPSSLFFSDTNQPDIYPASNQILCNQEDPVTAIVVYFDRLIVFNRRSMGQILGKTSDTFRYAAIPSSVGCVDNRTIQIRVIEGVPILIWLSDRGFYSYDGNSITYISEKIEDLVNFNIQQAASQKNSNTQTTQAQFSGGTASGGIDLTSLPGTITTKGYSNGTSAVGTNPRRNWDDSGDWDGGSAKTNLVVDTDNTIHTPIRYAPNVSTQGQLTNAIISGSDVKLSLATDFTGESIGLSDILASNNLAINTAFAYKITLQRAGTIGTFTGRFFTTFPGGSGSYVVRLWNNSLGSPGSTLTSSSSLPAVSGGNTVSSVALNYTVAAGTYWIGIVTTGNTGNLFATKPTTLFTGNDLKFFGSTWLSSNTSTTALPGGPFPVSYTFTQSAVSKSGSWLSDIYDSESDTISATLTALLTGSYPSGSFSSGPYTTTSTFTIEGSDDSLFSTGPEVTEDIIDLNGSQALSISGKRYWRLRIALSTTDDRDTPIVSAPILRFATISVWESEAIDCTADVTTYNSLVTTSNVPAGTSVTIEVKSSADDITYPDGYVAFGSVVVRRYLKVRATITSNTVNDTSASISSIIFKWTLQANLISSAIDTGITPPAGWDLFLASFTTNGGTAQFQMRSAATSGGLTSATFQTVTPSQFPSVVTPLQWVQWKVIVTSSDETVPEVDSVTIQWFITETNSVRPASIFVDGRYYIALAELEETTNNILLEFDLNGKWRRHDGLFVSTFSYFFNRPYLGLADDASIHKFLDSLTDNGVDIMFDWRSKAFDFSTTEYDNNSNKVKVVGELIIQGKNTGAEFEVQYSVDMGQNFYPLLTNSGASTFVTSTDGTNFYKRLRPNWNAGNPVSGRTIMYRILNEDDKEVSIKSLKVSSILRNQSTEITG